MPLHLPPISRRKFLGHSLAAGAGLLVAPRLLRAGAAKPADPNTFAMLADIHIAADAKQLGRGMNVTDHLRQVCDEVLALETPPAGVIVHGDCAYSTGKPGDYTQLIKLLKPVRERQLPIHLALGNHDNLDHFMAAMKPKASSPVARKFVSTLRTDRANFFFLDSLNGDPPSHPSNPGLLGDAQREWLSQQLKQHDEKPAVVIVHHTPGGMEDWKPLHTLMDEHKQVKAMFYGHRHTWGLSKTSGGVHLINLLPTSYPSAPTEHDGPQAGATGWTHATFADNAVKLHVRCHDHKHPLHDSIHDLKWRAA